MDKVQGSRVNKRERPQKRRRANRDKDNRRSNIAQSIPEDHATTRKAGSRYVAKLIASPDCPLSKDSKQQLKSFFSKNVKPADRPKREELHPGALAALEAWEDMEPEVGTAEWKKARVRKVQAMMEGGFLGEEVEKGFVVDERDECLARTLTEAEKIGVRHQEGLPLQG
ncbi:MAG: hypothetical protein Q9207_008556 [Kuettlingeria erythrocarpa]